MKRYKLKELYLSKLEYGSGAAACEYDGKTRYVRITDIDNEGNLGTDVVSPNSVDDKYLLNDGDVLFARTGATVGKTYLYRSSAGRCIYAGFLIRVVPNQEIIRPDYLYYFTKSPQYKGFIQSSMKVVAQPNINAKQYGDLEFNVPSLEEQDLIIKKLNAISSAIILRRTELIRLDELIKARFVEMFGGVFEYDKQLLSENVEEMFIGPFGSALKNECFVDKENSYCMVYEQKHAIQKTMNVPTRYIDEEKYEELKRFTVYGGDIIVSCRGTIGEVFLVPDTAPIGIMHPSIMKIRLKTDKYRNLFFAYMLEQFMRESIKKANGSGIKMAITAKELGKEVFIIPTLEKQAEFELFVNQINKSKVAVQAALDKAQLLFDSLMQEYFG